MQMTWFCELEGDLRAMYVSGIEILIMFWVNQVHMRQCRSRVMSGRRAGGAITSLVYARGLRLECARVIA